MPAMRVIDMKDTHGKDIKAAAVVGQTHEDALDNSVGGFFEGIHIDGALHINVKIIKNQDLIKTDSYPRALYAQPAYDKQRLYEDPYWNDVFNPPTDPRMTTERKTMQKAS